MILRAGLVFGVVLLLSVIGAVSLISAIVDRSGLSRMAGQLTETLLALGALVFLMSLVVVMRRLAVPIGHIVNAADRAGAGDFSVRVQEAGPPFLRSVAHAFNTMLGRLKTQDEQRRQLMADVAHELRTPLSVMQGRIEGILDGVYPRDDLKLEELLGDARVLARLVEDLRTLANAESGSLVLQREPTDPAVFAADVVRSFRTQADQQQVTLTLAAADGLPLVEIDPVRIREVLTNVVGNALQHTPAGGTIAVSLENRSDQIVMTVADTGSGVPADELSRIFDRFYRGAGSRGSGLGLAIARRLVVAHGGTITAASELGRGTTITLTLPVVDLNAGSRS
jgi:two-component system OmpR family sensor kinase/two-component system sensor histidine kinase BaeS